MSFFLRKQIKLGKFFRLNLSKSGLGISGGITGLRLSAGPRGLQFNAGRHGLYYRKSLNGIKQNNNTVNNNAEKRQNINDTIIQQNNNNKNFSQNITFELTGEKMSPIKLCEKINARKSKYKKIFIGWALLYYLCLTTNLTFLNELLILAFFALLLKLFITQYDITATCFSAPDEIIDKFKNFQIAFNEFAQSFKFNTELASTGTIGSLPFSCKTSNPKLKLPTFQIGKIKYFLAPEFIIKFDKTYDVFSYKAFDFNIKLETTHCKTLNTFANEEIIEQTWKYVKKDGTPNLRYKDNPRVYITKLTSLTIFGNTWYCSNETAVENLINALKSLKEDFIIEDLRNAEPQTLDLVSLQKN